MFPIRLRAAVRCPCTFTGGGIFVQGDASSLTLSAATVTVSGVVHPEQVFTIYQASTGVTTTVTVDLYGPTGTTTISDTSTGHPSGRLLLAVQRSKRTIQKPRWSM